MVMMGLMFPDMEVPSTKENDDTTKRMMTPWT